MFLETGMIMKNHRGGKVADVAQLILLFISAILLAHFNSHSCLKSPLSLQFTLVVICILSSSQIFCIPGR